MMKKERQFSSRLTLKISRPTLEYQDRALLKRRAQIARMITQWEQQILPQASR